MTRLRQRMLDELQRRNYSAHTVRFYMHAWRSSPDISAGRPDQLGPDAVWLLGDSVGHVRQIVLTENHAANNSGYFLLSILRCPC